MSRKNKNIKLILNNKIIINGTIKKYNKFCNNKDYVKKNEIRMQKIDSIALLKIKTNEKKCKDYIHNIIYNILLSIICILLLFLIKPNIKIILKYDTYKVGEEVVYNKEKWYVIENSEYNSDKLHLLASKFIDIDKNGIIDDNDRITFNIKKIRKLLRNNFDSIDLPRLITSEEYLNIKNDLSLGYFWDDGNFLANDEVYDWWVDGGMLNKIYSVNRSGAYKLNENCNKMFIRPVIEVYKSNLLKKV